VLKLSPRNLFPAKTGGGRRGGARRRLHTARNGVKLRQVGAETTTRYELLSRIQEPFLFVKRYVVIQIHFAARRYELAFAAGTLVSSLRPRSNSLSDVSCPISAGTLVR